MTKTKTKTMTKTKTDKDKDKENATVMRREGREGKVVEQVVVSKGSRQQAGSTY